jgi:ATP-binding protein involved in chromosome partitioning
VAKILRFADIRVFPIWFFSKSDRLYSRFTGLANESMVGFHVALKTIKKIIAVASGKGGVGKSTVAVNLALALAKNGAAVGLLDADIYGPSQPAMLGALGERPVMQDGVLLPIERHGLKSMSIGYLIDAKAPVVWRGPMLGKALEQLMNDTAWGNLDYLVIDLPPGTGDVQITLCQKMKVSGAVIVTTPQDLALLDVKRACEMFVKLNVPILGVVENMSVYHCSQCGHEEKIFGEGGGAVLSQEYQCELLGSIPLAASIREMTDSGKPPVAVDAESAYAKAFLTVAEKVAQVLAKQPKDYSSVFPKIVVEQKK